MNSEILDSNQYTTKFLDLDKFKTHKKFNAFLLGRSIDMTISDVDIRKYVKFLLHDGTISEKRRIMSSFKSSIIIKYKRISLIS